MRTILVALFLALVSVQGAQAEPVDCSSPPTTGIVRVPLAISDYGQILMVLAQSMEIGVWDELNGLTVMSGASPMGLWFGKMNNLSQVVFIYDTPSSLDYWVWDSVIGEVDIPLTGVGNINDDGLVAGLDLGGTMTIMNPFTEEVVWQDTGGIFDGLPEVDPNNNGYIINNNRDVLLLQNRYAFFWNGESYDVQFFECGTVRDINDDRFVIGSMIDDFDFDCDPVEQDVNAGFWWTQQSGIHTMPRALWTVANNGYANDEHNIYDLNNSGQLVVNVPNPNFIWSVGDNGQYAIWANSLGASQIKSTALHERPVVQEVGLGPGGNTLFVAGAHIEEGARVMLNVPFPPLIVEDGVVGAANIGSLPDGNYSVRVVNSTGCAGETFEFEVHDTQPLCGLTGIEPFLLLGFLAWRRKW